MVAAADEVDVQPAVARLGGRRRVVPLFLRRRGAVRGGRSLGCEPQFELVFREMPGYWRLVG